MSRIANILTRARDTLADPTGQRWSDERLLRLVSEAQQDIAKQTQMFKAQLDLPMVVGQRTYELPDNLWLITRASLNGRALELCTHEQLDFLERKQATRSVKQDLSCDFDDDFYLDVSWETDTGSTIEALIYDKRNLSEISVYPIPNESIADYIYPMSMEEGADYVGGESYGVITEMEDYTSTSDYGIVTELYEPGILDSGDFYGVTTQVSESDLVIHVWYVYIPYAVSSKTNDLELPLMWDTAIKHYVVGHAFDDDYDTRFAEKSQKALALYDRELTVSKEFERKNNVRAGHRATQYRGAFDK